MDSPLASSSSLLREDILSALALLRRDSLPAVSDSGSIRVFERFVTMVFCLAVAAVPAIGLQTPSSTRASP